MDEGSSLPTITTANSKEPHEYTPNALQSKNVRIHARRTSIRLEPAMWNALNEIAALEECSIHDLCGAVHDLKEPGASFTAALRVFMMEYYRSAALVNVQVSQVQRKIKAIQIRELQP
ncbi:MAG: ribbon-helix-helix domain-containing protein [Alphaproteobacteria bacterium]|nr:ribbon-helix-helix domain-containing protein [Alphaproteobacteria bacterium]